MQSTRVGLNFNESLLLLSIVFETIICSSLVSEPTDCRHPNDISDHRKDYPMMKKRIKRFLFPQIVLLNNNNCGCNRVRYPFGGIGGIGGIGGFPGGLGGGLGGLSTFSPLGGGGLGGGLGQVGRSRGRTGLLKARLMVNRRRLMRAQPIRSQRRRALRLNQRNQRITYRNDAKRRAYLLNRRIIGR